MRRSLGLALIIALVSACGGSAASTDPDAGSTTPPDAYREPYDAGPLPPYTGAHTFPALDLDPGEELLGVCQSWTLNNDEDIYVNAIVMDAGPGWHHSNWMFVPETAFTGPDGTWRCRERMFDEVAGSTAGGAVFFAQSTQTDHEEQRFPRGAVYRIPARSRVIGSIHVLNFSGEPLSTDLTFTIESIPLADVTVELDPLAIDNRVIDIPARGTATSTTSCDFYRATGGADWSIYYILPHYHALADGMRISVVGGPRDGETIFETTGGIGNVLGSIIDPPFSMAGARGLRVECAYANPGSDRVAWGVNGTDEMCTLLAYTDAGRQLGGFATTMSASETLGDGTLATEAMCLAISL